MDTKTLNGLNHEAFLHPENFVTGWDSMAVNVARVDAKYTDALHVGQKAKQIIINADGVWSALMLDNSMMQSYERIGYHSNTQHVLRGFLDSGAEIVVFRRNNGIKTIKARVELEGMPQE